MAGSMSKNMNIAWWVQRWCQLYPEKPAILGEGLCITYKELHGRANRTARWLQSMGLKKGDRVGVMMRNCPEFIDLYLACARLGVIFVPVNFRLTAAELAYILENARPRIFLFSAEFVETVGELRLRQTMPPMVLSFVGGRSGEDGMTDYLHEMNRCDDRTSLLSDSFASLDLEDPQVIMYTSGTTGRPKGAVLSFRKTFFNCLNAEIFFDLRFHDVMLIILPLFHSGGLFIQTSPTLYKGGTLILHSRFDPERVYDHMSLYRVTKFLGVPTIYRTLIETYAEKERNLSSLKVSAVGGEKVTPELLERCRKAGFPVRQIMGQTETSILFWASEAAAAEKPGTVGKPVFHAEVSLRDPQGRPVRVGEVGEIAVTGAIMMNGYWRDPVKTGETIRNGWLYTGDLARMDGDGYFYLMDRAKDMYISGGENVYPAEVESTLRQHPHVADAAVVGIPHNKWGEVGKAFVIPKNGGRVSAIHIIEFCRGRLAPYKWPREIAFCDDFPRTSLGKVKKGLLIK